ncbi:MAG: CvpA family protein [candidate division Zixibacteria bacterium]|nr:CvpA family protein [candidate division Zixibacteria bacterium]
MNWIDFGIIAFLLFNMARGFRNGLLRSVLDLVGVFFVLCIALTQFTRISGVLSDLLSMSSPSIRWLSLLVCLGVVMGVMNGITRLIGLFIKKESPAIPERAVGALLGVLRGAVIVSILLLLMHSFPFRAPIKSSIERSSLAPSALSIVPMIYDGFIVRIVPGSRPFVDQIDQPLKNSSNAPAYITGRSGTPPVIRL